MGSARRKIGTRSCVVPVGSYRAHVIYDNHNQAEQHLLAPALPPLLSVLVPPSLDVPISINPIHPPSSINPPSSLGNSLHSDVDEWSPVPEHRTALQLLIHLRRTTRRRAAGLGAQIPANAPAKPTFAPNRGYFGPSGAACGEREVRVFSHCARGKYSYV